MPTAKTGHPIYRLPARLHPLAKAIKQAFNRSNLKECQSVDVEVVFRANGRVIDSIDLSI